MTDDAMRRRAKSFEEGAVAYERSRPTFPDALFDDLVATAGPRLGRGVLEVGAGTGRATLPLARRGARIQVVEPSGDMLHILAERLHAEDLQDAVTVRQGTFEDVATGDGPYGVVVAAQSFHWTDPSTRWTRLARLLGNDGIAFLFWNGWQLDSTQHNLDAVRQVYRRDGGDLTPDIDDHRAGADWAQDEIAAEPALSTAESTSYAWDWELPVDDYLSLLATTSQYAVADLHRRRQLFNALRAVLGDTVRLDGRTQLLSTRPQTIG
ncbi:class I SAM-dependent methyltransferase [Leekyejoonella antrihumi]|uniref:Class I SAM-dependent methyltransferase n=1 Tax=Leekyejoonella antrihumi TaxID=1660198 RepID=A0A563DVS7_9MICO|nr:class I SAM-dependent methyltransferase [Leekyejoonella antrihumi]TWP34306.1 class I SAM-dependent methyltransferase [Leekyejoonella antrihumi]